MGEKIKFQPLLKTGEYVAQITAAKVVDGKFGVQVEIKFELTGSYTGREMTAWASAKFGPSTKLYRWWSAATRGTLKPSNDFDCEDLVGRTVVLVVTQETSDKSIVSNRVKDLLPVEDEEVETKV